MSAKEMFEELGYKKIEDSSAIQYLNDGQQLRFWKNSKYIEMFGGKNIEVDLDNTEYYYAKNVYKELDTKALELQQYLIDKDKQYKAIESPIAKKNFEEKTAKEFKAKQVSTPKPAEVPKEVKNVLL